MLPSLRRSARLAFDNLFRNRLLSLATILLMALILLIFNILFGVNLMAQRSIEALEQKVDLIVYLSENADPLLISRLVQKLKEFPEVLEITYTTKEEALESLLIQYAGGLNPVTEYDLENPLPSSLQIVTEKPEDHEDVMTYLEQASYESLFLDIESRAENEAIVANLTQITTFTEKLLLGIVVTFLLGSVLIIANAIHLTLFHRKREIDIMKLVGAPMGFIRAPFVLEGALYGIGSVGIGFVLFVIFIQTIDLSQIQFLQGKITYGPLLAVQLIAGSLLGMGSSLFALQPYLKRSCE